MENFMEMPTLPRKTRVPFKLKDFIKEKQQPISVEEKYKSIYFETIAKIFDEIKNRLNDDSIAPILLIERIIKGKNHKNNLDDLIKLNLYNQYIDFETLKIELITWKHVFSLYKKEIGSDLTKISEISTFFDQRVSLQPIIFSK